MAPNIAALIAALLLLPAGVLFVGIVFQIEALEVFMKFFLTEDGESPSALGRAYMLGSLIALPVSLLIALFPMLIKGANGERHFYLANALIAILALIMIVPIFYGIGEEIYRCDILKVPNCD